jgi:hypothetical protein
MLLYLIQLLRLRYAARNHFVQVYTMEWACSSDRINKKGKQSFGEEVSC